MAANKNPSGKRKTGQKTASMAEEDARALWEDVAKTVKRQSSSRISPVDLPAERAKKTAPVKKPASPAKKTGKIAIQPNSAKNPEAEKFGHITGPANLAKPVYAGIDRSSAKKIQQGKMPLEARLDLHGLSQLEARHHLQQFIATALQNGLRNILVITGKGRAGQGVLRTNVPQWLSEPPLSDHIIAFGPSRPQDGGAGALYVRLKRIREA
jgi:DNA-nicking Smr family endonuclease